MSLGEGKEARGEPASRYKAQNWTPELRARPRRRPSPGRTPSCPLRFQPRETLFLSSNGSRGGEVPARSPLDPKQQQKTHRSGRRSRCRAPAPTASRARPRLPADCGGEPFFAAAAPDAGHPSSSSSGSNSSSGRGGQQRREEEVLRSRPASRSAAISTPRAAAAAAATAPRSARALPSARFSRSLRRRLGSSPARPGPRGPLARPGGKTAGASLLQRGGEESREGESVHSGRELGGASVSPGSRRRHPPPTRAPHGRARGAETEGWGAGAGARRAAHAHSRARAPPLPASTLFAPRGLPGSNPGGRFAGSRGGGAELAQGQAAGRLPSPPCSPEPGTGAGRARRALLLLLLASGKPRRSDPPPCRPPPAPNPRERFPLTSSDGFKGYGDLRQSRSDA